MSYDKLEELKSDVPALVPYIDAANEKLAQAYRETKAAFDEFSPLTLQRDFAIMIQSRTKLSGICFTARKTGKSFDEVWRSSADLLIKMLFS